MNTEKNREQVLLKIKRHWIVLLRGIFLVLFLWFICFFGFLVANGVRGGAPVISIGLFLICLILLIFAHHWLFLNFLGWELSIWIVTNTRVINFKNIPYIENDVNFININEIDQIEQEERGFIQNLLNFGTVIINIPANQQHIVFRYLPHPTKLANIIEAVQKHRSVKTLTIHELSDFFRRKYEYILEKQYADKPESELEV